jgi:competence protein ComEA
MIGRGGWLLAGAALAAGFVLAVIAGFLLRSPDPAPIIIDTPVPTATIEPTITPGPTETAQAIQAYVNGAVNEPDVYILSPGSRVKQIVEAAGGFTDEANTAVINLAMPLVDGMQIYVPELKESTAEPQQIITQPTMPSRAGIGVGDLLININTAEQEELETLPGIGPVTAQKIIDYRTANGGFSTIEAILDVSGIGEVTFENIRDLITVR